MFELPLLKVRDVRDVGEELGGWSRHPNLGLLSHVQPFRHSGRSGATFLFHSCGSTRGDAGCRVIIEMCRLSKSVALPYHKANPGHHVFGGMCPTSSKLDHSPSVYVVSLYTGRIRSGQGVFYQHSLVAGDFEPFWCPGWLVDPDPGF